MKIITLLSGGLDSTTLLYLMKRSAEEVKALTINYGQRHNREIIKAGQTCKKLGVDWILLNLNDLRKVMSSSALINTDIKVPEGSYTELTMKQTIVPNRNMIFLSIAAAWALSLNYDGIAYAAHTGDHTIYPDCREAFFTLCEQTINVGNAWNKPIRIYAPFSYLSKADILRIGVALNVDYSLTQTCYKGDITPCGKCGACIERKEAFDAVGAVDPLIKEIEECKK